MQPPAACTPSPLPHLCHLGAERIFFGSFAPLPLLESPTSVQGALGLISPRAGQAPLLPTTLSMEIHAAGVPTLLKHEHDADSRVLITQGPITIKRL